MSKDVSHLIVQEDDLRSIARFNRETERLTLQFNLKDELEKGAESLAESLKGYSSLTKLNLFIEYIPIVIASGCQSYEASHFKHIYGLIQGAKLHDLSVNTGLSNSFTDEAAVHLAEALKLQTQLRSLVLRIEAYNNLTSKGFNQLLRAVSTVSLTSLHVYIEEDNNIEGESLQVLGELVARNPKLTHLLVQVGNDTVSSANGWSGFGKQLASAKHLEHLVINIGTSNNVGVDGILAIYDGISQLVALRVLKLKIAGQNNTKDASLAGAQSALKHLKALTHLRFRIGEWNSLTDQSLKSFSEGLASLSTLQHLHIQIGHLTYFTNEGTIALASAIEQLKQLTKLDLQIGSKNSFNGEALDALAKSLKALTQLLSFRLNIDNGNQATQAALGNLGQAVANLPHISEVRINFADIESCDGNKLLHFSSALPTANPIQDLLLTVGESERIHFSNKKNSLTFQFKGPITHDGVQLFLQTLNNLSSNTQKLKVDTRDMAIGVEDVEALKKNIDKLKAIRYLKFRVKNVPTVNVVGYLDLFQDYVHKQELLQVSLDIGQQFKSQFTRPQESKKSTKKQRGSQLLVNAEPDSKLGAAGATIVKDLINRESQTLKEISLKLGTGSEITKQNLQSITHAILECPYISKLSFDIQDNQEDLKGLLPKVKQHLDQFIKDKKNLVNTYNAVTLKQWELVSTQLNPEMLNDVSTFLMKSDGTEKITPTTATPIPGGFGGLFGQKQVKGPLSDSSFNDDQDDEEFIEPQNQYFEEE